MSNKRNIHRMDIWMVNLKLNCESVMNGKRPCIILSSWRTCIRKTGIVNVVPLTTNLTKYLDVHIDLEGYNLKEMSKILCNQVLTIDKDLLLFRLGKIDSISKQLEIEKAVETQMDLTKSRLNVEDTDELENFFMGRVKNISNRAVYDDLKNEIRELLCNGENEKCIIACDKLKLLVIDSDLGNKNEYLWFCSYHSAIMFNRLGDYKSALANAQTSLKYVGNLQESLNRNYGYTMFLLAYCYSFMGKNEKSITIYRSLSSYYKKENKRHLRINVLFNIAKINNNIKKMSFLIGLINNLNYDDFETNSAKERLLKQMEVDYLEVTKIIS